MFTAIILIAAAAALPAESSGIQVEPNTPTEGRWTISSDAYRMVLNLVSPRIDSFTAGDFSLIGEGMGLAPTINTGAPWGPAQATVAMAGPAVTHVVLYGMRWEKILTGDIQVHFFCYPNRVVARMDIIPHAAPPALHLGWVGQVTQVTSFPEGSESPDWQSAFRTNYALMPAALLLPPLQKGSEGRRGAHLRIEQGGLLNAHYVYNAHDIGTRSITCTLLAAEDESSLRDLLAHEIAIRRMQFDVTNGRYRKYDDTTGMHQFIMKPSAKTMTIKVTNGPVQHPLIAAVIDQRRRNIRLSTSQPNSTSAQWMPRRFNSETLSASDKPGAYVFPLEALPDGHSLRVQPKDSTTVDSGS